MPAGESSDEKDLNQSVDSYEYVQQQVEKEKKYRKKKALKDRKNNQENQRVVGYFDAYDDVLDSKTKNHK